ncbi:histidine kinase N-terminal 7TM domain-containing diguanylate cyclase [Pseudomonas sp. S9]|uniref:histidine kinase N-terminal 7TM domain-containing diguanylate cyclase n=1 Tax=Pseudomonas sp. S9 TaxID=686578 RepID=UPI0002557737|nr:histidine kinase N-terminal 7TM domain-containing protein [Pseudomonas sp. S9]
MLSLLSSCSQSGWDFPVQLLITGVVCFGVLLLSRWVSQQRYFPGQSNFIWLHLACLWWMLAASVEMAAQGAECKVFWASMAWPGILLTPTFWAVFLWQYIYGKHQRLSSPVLAMLMLAPALCWVLALTNPWHHLMYTEQTAPLSGDYGSPIKYVHGSAYYVATAYGYICMLFCSGIVIRAVLQSSGLYRRHYLVFLLLTLVPWAVNASHVFLGVSLFGFDPTPFSFAFTLMAFAWLIVGVRLFDLLPVARNLLLEALFDPVLVVDSQMRVVEVNPSALKLSGLERGWQGRRLQDWAVLGAKLHELMSQVDGCEPNQLLSLPSLDRYFELNIRAVERTTRHEVTLLGQMLYLRDVSQRHISELQLADALAVSEQRLQTILELHEQLREQALCDPLTGLYNRRYLEEFFAREIDRVQREQKPLSLALIDLDHFKLLNDKHGHLEGDDVLKALADKLRRNVRSSDAAFRIGGEEFLLVLPGADLEEASKRLNIICKQLAQQPLETRGGLRQVTLSAGIACWPTQGLNLDELLDVADAALYQAKRAGRNQVVTFG